MSGLLLLCAIACTIVVFHLIFDEHTKLFYINVATACVAEALLLANIPLFSSGRLLTFKNAASSVVMDTYAILLFLWTVVYSLFIEEESDYKVLYIGMLALTVVFLVAFAAVEMGGSVMQQEEEAQNSVAASKRAYLVSLNDYFLSVQEMLSPVRPDWADDALRTLRLTLDKVAILPSEKLGRNPSATAEINRRLEDIKQAFSASAANGDEPQRQQLTEKINQLRNYVTNLKTSL